MFKFLRNLIRLPSNISEDDARVGGILQNIVLATWTFPVLIAILAIIFPARFPTLIIPEISVLVLLGILSLMIRNGLIRPASMTLIMGLILISIYINYQAGGEFRSTFVATVTVILMGGLLLGTRGAIVAFILIVAEEIVLAWAGSAGYIRAQTGAPEPIINYVVTFVGYFVSLLIFQISASSLSRQLDISRAREQEVRVLSAELEQRVQQRTSELNRRTTQLEAASLVAKTAAEVSTLSELLETVVQQITERFNFYHAGIFLVDTNREFVILEAASSEGGKKMIERGHKLAIGRQGIVGFAAYQKRPRIAQDVGADAIFFNNVDLPETHSEMALPLLARNRLVGVLDIQSEEHNAFSNDDISTLQIMADQIALAIENARLLNESRSTLDQLQVTTNENVAGAWRERLGRQSRGYSYTSVGIAPISAADRENGKNGANNDGRVIKIPVSLRGQRIGELALVRKSSESSWTETEREMADKIAIQVGLAVENARLLEESQRRAQREQTISDLSSRFSRSLDVDTLLQNAVRELHRIPQVSEVSVYISPVETTDTQKNNGETE